MFYWRNTNEGIFKGLFYWRNSNEAIFEGIFYWRNTNEGIFEGIFFIGIKTKDVRNSIFCPPLQYTPPPSGCLRHLPLTWNVKYFCLFDIIIIISSYKAKITAIISDFNNIILMSENIREGKDYLRSRCYRRTFFYLKIRS